MGRREELTPLRRSIAQARARESRLDDLLGPQPQPPRTPKVGTFYVVFQQCSEPPQLWQGANALQDGSSRGAEPEIHRQDMQTCGR